MNKALCWLAAIFAIAAIILIYEVQGTNDGPDYQAYTRWVKDHNKALEEAK